MSIEFRAGLLDRAVDLAFAELTAGVTGQRARHAELEGELSAIQSRIDRLLDALADGSVPRDEVAVRLNADLHNKVGDVKGLLGIRSRKPARCLESSSLTRSRSNLSAAAGGADSNSVAH